MQGRAVWQSASKARFGSSRADSVDTFLDVSELLLTTLKNVGAGCTVPFMNDAAELALGILNAAQAVRENGDAWKRLATDAAELVVAVAHKVDGGERVNIDNELRVHLQELHGMLKEIHDFATKRGKRNLLKRIIGFRDDAVKIKEYRENLNQSIDLFGVRAAINSAEKLEEVRGKQTELLDGQGCIRSRQEDMIKHQETTLSLLHKIDTSLNSSSQSSSPSTTLVPSSSAPESPASSQTPQETLKGFQGIIPINSTITIISGDKIENNNHTVINNHNTGQVKNINTINSYNYYTRNVHVPVQGMRASRRVAKDIPIV